MSRTEVYKRKFSQMPALLLNRAKWALHDKVKFCDCLQSISLLDSFCIQMTRTRTVTFTFNYVWISISHKNTSWKNKSSEMALGVSSLCWSYCLKGHVVFGPGPDMHCWGEASTGLALYARITVPRAILVLVERGQWVRGHPIFIYHLSRCILCILWQAFCKYGGVVLMR